LGLLAKTCAPIALTPVTADRYVVINSHYDRAYAEKPGPSHNTGLTYLWVFLGFPFSDTSRHKYHFVFLGI